MFIKWNNNLVLFLIYSQFFQSNHTNLQEIHVKNVHSVSSNVIRAHNLKNTHELPPSTTRPLGVYVYVLFVDFIKID